MSVRNYSFNFHTAVAAMRLARDVATLDLTSDDYDFLVGAGAYANNPLWLPKDRALAKRCIESAVYGGLDSLGFPRFPMPVEYVAAVIALYVHPVNIQAACSFMQGDYADAVMSGAGTSSITAGALFAHVLTLLSDNQEAVQHRDAVVMIMHGDSRDPEKVSVTKGAK